MADTIVDSSTMDNETAEVFVKKLDLACIALNNPNQQIEGYGVGMEAAYQLLCEAQAMSPDNQAIATEIATLQHLMHAADDENAGNTAPALPETSNSPVTDEAHSLANQVMQHWNSKPIIEVLVCVTESNLKSLADTIDSIAAQIYSNWKLTVISNMPSPDPVFSQHDILEWVQTSDFQTAIDQEVSNSNANWVGLIPAGGYFDKEALFAVANLDNLKGERTQIVCSDNNDQVSAQPLSNNPSTDAFCFTRTPLLQQIGGIHLTAEKNNEEIINRALSVIDPSAVAHIPSILFAQKAEQDNSLHSAHEIHSNVA